jgi:hypothetical protein
MTLSGGTAIGTIIFAGQENVFAGGTDIGATVRAAGNMFVFGGTAISANVIGIGGTLDVGLSGGGRAIGTMVQSGATLNVLRGGIDVSATIISASANVSANGTDISATVRTGGALLIYSGGTSISAAGAIRRYLCADPSRAS